MVAYVIKFILCSGFLYSFYKLLLERESMYKINRFYLLFSLVFSLTAPLYKIDLPITANETNISPELLAFLMQNPDVLQQEEGINFGDILNVIYILFAVLFLARFSYNLYNLLFKIKTEEKIKDHEITYVLDLQSSQPYSFWNYIFIPKKQLENLHQNLIDHEKAHCIQKHSFDILWIEIFQILFWFNPFIYFYKKSIKLNHEFLADEYVLKRNSDLKTYQHQILDCIATQNPSMMASNFNFILTKKRLLMMTKNTSNRKAKILSFASLPFILSAFVLFSQKSFAQEVENKAKKVEQALEKPVQSQADLIFDTKEENKITKNLNDTITLIKKLSDGKTMTKEELKDILKSNPQNKIILNDAGDIILNDSIKIKDIVRKKELIPTTLYGKDGKVLQKIDPKDINKVIVKKSEGLIEIFKKDSSVIRIFNSEKDIPNIDKKVTTAKMPTVKNNITLKNGYSIYTDKFGVEHKIISSEIDKVYLENQLKSKGIDNGYSVGFSKNKGIDKTEIENQLKESQARGYDITALKTDPKNPEIQKLGSFTVKTFYSEDPKEMSKYLEEKKKELVLQEKNTKQMLKEIEKKQKQLKKEIKK
ncbi:M56 family metallopeptidase [Empedobacter stercoris]|uniref:M56 family metallopeptidase n=1 Tax=Empedobacter stercoris TaxID=1628248 RepID=UPI0016623274|nr:M56 family metallopeptidase [Empedobacter stercoris]MCA4809543.1 M56 family metallopeptidase [Empedobacter stercoris]QNT13468.1 M56 family metallopeptidase [Empedobacter stercoris]